MEQNPTRIKLPYIVTIDTSSREVLSIRRNYKAEDPLKNKIEYPFYFTDETTLKTMVRANPGLIYLQKGTIKRKWHHNDFPSLSHIELQ